jgi:hypothetical protein
MQLMDDNEMDGRRSLLIGLLLILLVLLIVKLPPSTCAKLETTMRADFLERLQELELFGVGRTLMEDWLRLSKLIG